MWETFNWITTLWTVITGPILGYKAYEAQLRAGSTELAATSIGIVAGIASTAAVAALSYGLYNGTGMPALWRFIIR